MNELIIQAYHKTMVATAKLLNDYNKYQADTKNNYLYNTMNTSSSVVSAYVTILKILNDYEDYKKYVKTDKGKAFIKKIHTDFGYEFDDLYFERL